MELFVPNANNVRRLLCRGEDYTYKGLNNYSVVVPEQTNFEAFRASLCLNTKRSSNISN